MVVVFIKVIIMRVLYYFDIQFVVGIFQNVICVVIGIDYKDLGKVIVFFFDDFVYFGGDFFGVQVIDCGQVGQYYMILVIGFLQIDDFVC